MKSVDTIIAGLGGCKTLACQLLTAQCFMVLNCGLESDPLLHLAEGLGIRDVG
jgi:hypothetical protein